MKKPISILLVLLVTLGMLAAVPMAALADCAEAPTDTWNCTGADANGMDATTNGSTDTVTVDPGATVDNTALGGAAIIMTDGTLTNDGSVSENADAGTGVLSTGGADVTNNDAVSANGSGGAGVITLNGDVTNNGTVTANGDGGTGVFTDTGDVTNNDTISASGLAGTGIATGSGDNTVTLGAGSTTSGSAAAVSTGGGNDNVKVEDGATVNGLIDGGANTDTLTFTFFTQSELSSFSPAAGSYMGYTWANFEQLIGMLIHAAQNGHKHVYFKNKEINARGVSTSKLTGINIYAEPGLIAFVPFSALPLIPFNGGVRFQRPNPENWFAVVVNRGPYESNVDRNLYQVFIYDGNGALVSEDQSFVY